MQRLLPWLGLALGLALLAVLARRSEGLTGPLSTSELASVAYQVGIVVLIGGAVMTIFRQNFTQALAGVLFWVAIAFMLVLAYTYRFELARVGDRVLVELVPGRTATRGRSVELSRANTGEFRVGTEVNGVSIAMVLDTGASSVVLTHDAAKKAGLPLELLKYSVSVETANGHTLAAPVTLDRVAVRGIVEHQVPALIAQPGQLRLSLLGMSFLNRLQSWEVRGSSVLMRGYP
ncbi:MAG TPA: TIGR02281 family clan AA aspartic protease [Xanthobacteraceae bacterium]|nr:TIGR02281 family clan AA aspartic protease [Xanthobacteraceae bacterium]